MSSFLRLFAVVKVDWGGTRVASAGACLLCGAGRVELPMSFRSIRINDEAHARLKRFKLPSDSLSAVVLRGDLS